MSDVSSILGSSMKVSAARLLVFRVALLKKVDRIYLSLAEAGLKGDDRPRLRGHQR